MTLSKQRLTQPQAMNLNLQNENTQLQVANMV